ncbi:MAG: ATP-binding cassette domain-containing protein [candidate division Zixibacteria bacterium]|nr:ATP-binding cassette domain-containing protein [candidate division Zixibacteria bacterium]
MTYLSLENVRKVYDEKVAVNDLSLQVPKGVILGIIGPNGAGKTTTIRMVMNITAPDSGSVLFEGRKIDESFKNRVGYLPEERGLYKKMTLEEIILYMAQLKDCPRAVAQTRIAPWLERMGLSDYRLKKVEELSKGMQQKLQFITTILHDPDIIILDELFSGLDPVNMELMKGVVQDLKRSGKTILFSTHVMEQAEKLCDHICMISGGNKVIDGTMAEVKARFGKNSVQIVIDGDGSFIRTLPGVKSVMEFGTYHELKLVEGADTQVILRSLIERVNLYRFEVVEPSLYDIFIDMAKVNPAEMTQDAVEANV